MLQLFMYVPLSLGCELLKTYLFCHHHLPCAFLKSGVSGGNWTELSGGHLRPNGLEVNVVRAFVWGGLVGQGYVLFE